ncbi:MAG: methyl-accepting chemotaxis protein, partial [Spirochaetia bacterium]|nr:methyl-accepting chemotaxis protein [Spirochaetia bacterium]
WFYKCKVSKDVSFFPEKMGINTEDTSLPKNIFFWTQPVSGGCIVLFENTILVSQDVFSRITHIRKNQKMKSIQAHVMSNDGLVLFSSDSDWNKYILNKDKSNPVAQYIKFAPLGSEREAFNAKQVMFSWSNIKDHISAQDNLLWNGSVVIQVDMSEVFKPLYYLIFMLIGLVIFVTSVSSFISYSRSKKLVHIPISDLEEVMEKISSGDLSMQDIKIDHNDDIGYFAFNLNKMVVKFRTMLILIVQSGKDVVHEGRQFFVNLGNLQNSSVRIGNLIKDATLNLNNIKNASEEIFFDATKQQDLVEKNKIAMQNLEKSFDQSADKRLEITRSARNVAQKSNTGLQTIDEFAKNVQKIADSSKKIKGIINLIDDVSDQTNLLALNASIEAARAGVHGHGFSVVANEISELAKRSAKSAEEISVLIKETVQQVLDVSNKVESARSIFKQIAQMMESLDKEIVEMANYTSRQQIDVTDTGGRVQTVVDISRKISERTKEQSEVSENLLKIMEQIDHLAVENRDEIEKDDQMLQGFMGKIQDLIETANQFKVSSAILSLDTNENKDMEKSDNKSILEVHSVT